MARGDAQPKPKMPAWAEAERERLNALHGDARLAGMWKVIEKLAADGDVESKIFWLRGVMNVAWKEGRVEYGLRAFDELRRIYESDSRFTDLRPHILWYYKWIMEELPEYAEPTAEQIETLFTDMERFYTAERESPRPIYGLRLQAAICMGKSDDAVGWFEKWQAEPKGKSDDCAACEAAREIHYLIDRERHEDALQAAEPILRGKIYCDDIPETLTRLIHVAMRLQKPKLAQILLRVSGRPVWHVRGMLGALGAHVVFRFLTGDFIRARRLAIVALRRALDARNDVDRFNVYRAVGAWAALAVMTRQQDKPLPRRLMPPGSSQSDEATIALPDVASVCLAEAARIAAMLDTRNGTTRYADRLTETEGTIRKALTSKPETRLPPEAD